MKHFPKLAILATFAFFSAAHAQDGQDVQKATDAAQRWLGLADTQQYAATYTGAATAFKKAISQQDWEQALLATRKPLGGLKRRTLMSATFKKEVPGAPPGEYVVIVYTSEFANQPSALEKVIPMRDADGAWKVSGYHVR